MEKDFEKFKKELNYKCPVCKSDFSIEDRYCPNCKTDFLKIFINKINYQVEILKALADPLPWKIWEILLTLFIYFIFIISFNRYLLKFYFNYQLNSQYYFLITFIIYTIANLLLFFLPYYFVSIKRNISIYIFGLNKISHTNNYFYLLFFSSLLFVLPILFIIKIQKLSEAFISDTYFWIFEISNNYYFYFLIILNFLIIEPIATEVFFRGFFYNKLRLKISYLFSAIIVSLVYALLIGNFFISIIFFFLSFFFCLNSDYHFTIRYNIEIKFFINLFLLIFFLDRFNLLLKISFLHLFIFAFSFFIIFFIIEFYRVKNKKYSLFKIFSSIKYFILIIFFYFLFAFIFYFSNNNFIIELKAKDYYYSHSLKETISYIEKIKNKNKSLELFLAGLYYTNGQFQESLNLIKEIQKKVNDEERLELNNLLALNYGELEQNIDFAFKIIQELYNKKNNIAYYETMGWLYFKMGNLQEAERILNDYVKKIEIENNKENAEVFYHLGSLYYAKNDFLNAKKYFVKAKKYYPESYFGLKSKEYLDKINDISK